MSDLNRLTPEQRKIIRDLVQAELEVVLDAESNYEAEDMIPSRNLSDILDVIDGKA